jgi:hypothetical protein
MTVQIAVAPTIGGMVPGFIGFLNGTAFNFGTSAVPEK